jgi:hypothetical protein
MSISLHRHLDHQIDIEHQKEHHTFAVLPASRERWSPLLAGPGARSGGACQRADKLSAKESEIHRQLEDSKLSTSLWHPRRLRHRQDQATPIDFTGIENHVALRCAAQHDLQL